MGVRVNPKNVFDYVKKEALPWAAWLDRDGKYVGEDLKSEDDKGRYLVYFNKNVLEYYGGQDEFDKKEVLSAVKLWLGGISYFDVDRVVPLLFDGIGALDGIVGDKLDEPLFGSRDEMRELLFSSDFMVDAFNF